MRISVNYNSVGSKTYMHGHQLPNACILTHMYMYVMYMKNHVHRAPLSIEKDIEKVKERIINMYIVETLSWGDLTTSP